MICTPIRPKSKYLYILGGLLPSTYFVIMGILFEQFYPDLQDFSGNNCVVTCMAFAGIWLFFTTYAYCKGYNLWERCAHGAVAGGNLVTAAAIYMEDDAYRRQGYIVIRDSNNTYEAYSNRAMQAAVRADRAEEGLAPIKPAEKTCSTADKICFGVFAIAYFGLFLGAFLLMIPSPLNGYVACTVYFAPLGAILAISYCCFGPLIVHREESIASR